MNPFLSFLAGIITDINFSDIETCYKAVRTRLLKSIPFLPRTHYMVSDINVYYLDYLKN